MIEGFFIGALSRLLKQHGKLLSAFALCGLVGIVLVGGIMLSDAGDKFYLFFGGGGLMFGFVYAFLGSVFKN